MNEIMTIGGVDCYEKDGTAYLKLENVARGLGFVQAKNGVEYVRWETIGKYIEELGFPNKLGKEDFIPENIFYRLAMKAKNETAERFQAKVADEIIPSIRRTGGYGIEKKPLSIEDAFRLMGLINSTPSEKQPIIREVFSQAGVYIPEEGSYTDNIREGRRKPIYSDADGQIAAFLQGINPIGIPTNDVYREYAQYCSEYGCDPIPNVTFSKKVNQILGIKVIDKKVDGRKRRVFVC